MTQKPSVCTLLVASWPITFTLKLYNAMYMYSLCLELSLFRILGATVLQSQAQ